MLAREVLALEPPADSLLIAEARVICAMLAAGESWDIDAIREPLTDALAGLARWTADGAAIHPIAAMAEPMLALFSGDGDSALTVIESYTTMADPWMRAAGWLYRSTHCLALGRLDDTESDCRTALAQFRVLGDAWGIAVSLMQSAELAQLRGDYATAVAALEESAEIGLELQALGRHGVHHRDAGRCPGPGGRPGPCPRGHAPGRAAPSRTSPPPAPTSGSCSRAPRSPGAPEISPRRTAAAPPRWPRSRASASCGSRACAPRPRRCRPWSRWQPGTPGAAGSISAPRSPPPATGWSSRRWPPRSTRAPRTCSTSAVTRRPPPRCSAPRTRFAAPSTRPA